ncbi:hypothetical protein K7G98_39430, partial [Saccharothrix sp. MB29]|nr:hypothetical protein [Saccharothrix sp. MB29]
VWFRPDGEEMAETDWFDDGRRFLGMWIDGSTSLSRSRDGELASTARGRGGRGRAAAARPAPGAGRHAGSSWSRGRS